MDTTGFSPWSADNIAIAPYGSALRNRSRIVGTPTAREAGSTSGRELPASRCVAGYLASSIFFLAEGDSVDVG